jgi:1-acyl-sn-glycerol-3-phosphate acyltransferase
VVYEAPGGAAGECLVRDQESRHLTLPARIDPSSALPRRGNFLTRALGRLLLRLLRWRVREGLPNVPKAIAIIAPHSSNLDFLIGIGIVFSMDLNASWIGKIELFRWPMGSLMRWLGGIPVDRRASHGLVDQVVAEYQRRDQLIIGITPEGTRRRGAGWKLGFYWIAVKAKVPIVPICVDWKKREWSFLPPFYPTGNIELDLPTILAHYASLTRRDGHALTLTSRT